jgi:hypothetical protein
MGFDVIVRLFRNPEGDRMKVVRNAGDVMRGRHSVLSAFSAGSTER